MRRMSMRAMVTAEELLAMPRPWAGRRELWAGELRVMSAAAPRHGLITSRFDRLLAVAEDEGAGFVLAGDVGFVLARGPDTVIAPDVAFVERSRWPDRHEPGFFEGPPDLAIEVLSPSDRPKYVATKVATWLRHGTREVWIADPRRLTVTLHWLGEASVVVASPAFIHQSRVLPALRVPLDRIFAGCR
jgi:Uma2 family endonuclease